MKEHKAVIKNRRRAFGRTIYYLVLLSFLLPIGFLIYRIAILTGDDSTGFHSRADYVLMLVQCVLGLVVIHIPSILSRNLKFELPGFLYIFYIIFLYWVIGMAIGSLVSVFARDKIHGTFSKLQGRKLGLFGIIPACLLGIASPLCMYGTIPIAASFRKQGMREDWLAAFMMASILLNPQLIVYSAALGATALIVRIVTCFLLPFRFGGLAGDLRFGIYGFGFELPQCANICWMMSAGADTGLENRGRQHCRGDRHLLPAPNTEQYPSR